MERKKKEVEDTKYDDEEDEEEEEEGKRSRRKIIDNDNDDDRNDNDANDDDEEEIEEEGIVYSIPSLVCILWRLMVQIGFLLLYLITASVLHGQMFSSPPFTVVLSILLEEQLDWSLWG